jgi:myo-inositol-1(or 4)-monophosphatase
MNGNSERIKNIFLKAALSGGKILKENFLSENLRSSRKSSISDIVTEIDKKVQEYIIDIISKELPEVRIIAEENEFKGDNSSNNVIYLDPVDGTLNFYHGQRQFAISIGYWENDKPIVGVVFNPIDDDLFFAISGRGAYRNGRRIMVSQCKSLDSSILATGWPYDKKEISRVLRSLEFLMPVTQEVRIWGTSALTICYLAAGALEGYWEWGLYPWDIAGGLVVAKEAGSTISSINGEPFELASGEILVTNGRIHEEILYYLQKTVK